MNATSLTNLATSDDMKGFAVALKPDFERFELRIREDLEWFHQDLREALRESRVTIIKWLVSLMLGQIAVLAAVIELL